MVESGGAAATVFVARPRVGAVTSGDDRTLALLRRFRLEGWHLGVEDMLGRPTDGLPCYEASSSGRQVVFGIFEAPSLAHALSGVEKLEEVGWSAAFRTEWTIGVRDLPSVEGERANPASPGQIGFLAFWVWNDAWHTASGAERADYDRECDVAFDFDRRSGIHMSGRHRAAWASEWDHFSVWEATGLGAVDRAMREHERVSDFMFTTSRHLIGRKIDLSSFWRTDATAE